MRPGRAASRSASPRFECHDGLAAADAPGDAGKAARVAEGFEVEQNHVGVRVFFPVLEEVVARDIRLVTDTYKCREAQVEAASGGQDRQTQSAALGGHSYS